MSLLAVPRGRGLKPPTPGKSAHRLGAAEHHADIRSALGSGIRGNADLSSFLCGRMDQGSTETCFAHSGAAGIFTARAAVGKPMLWVPSPLLIASTTYADVRAEATAAGQPLPVLQDTGAQLQDVATAMAKWGVGPIGADVQGRYSDVPADNGYSFPEPDPAKLVVSGQTLIGGEYQIAIDDNAPETVAASLDAVVPVWIGGLVGQAYQAATATSVQGPTPANDSTAGGHAQFIVAYRTNAAGELEFLVVNSWGTGWASNGMVWVSAPFIQALWMAWPLAVAA
jgi:hypothetical protein